MKDWEIVTDNLSKAIFSLGWLSSLDLEGRTVWIVDAHGYGNRFIVHADEKFDCVSGTRIGDSTVFPSSRTRELLINTAQAQKRTTKV